MVRYVTGSGQRCMNRSSMLTCRVSSSFMHASVQKGRKWTFTALCIHPEVHCVVQRDLHGLLPLGRWQPLVCYLYRRKPISAGHSCSSSVSHVTYPTIHKKKNRLSARQSRSLVVLLEVPVGGSRHGTKVAASLPDFVIFATWNFIPSIPAHLNCTKEVFRTMSRKMFLPAIVVLRAGPRPSAIKPTVMLWQQGEAISEAKHDQFSCTCFDIWTRWAGNTDSFELALPWQISSCELFLSFTTHGKYQSATYQLPSVQHRLGPWMATLLGYDAEATFHLEDLAQLTCFAVDRPLTKCDTMWEFFTASLGAASISESRRTLVVRQNRLLLNIQHDRELPAGSYAS